MSVSPLSPLVSASLARASGDPDWLAAARAAGLERYAKGGLPSRAEHLWRYTDPVRLVPGSAPSDPETRFGDLPPDFADGTFERASAYAIARDGVLLRAAVDPLIAHLGFLVEDLRAAAASRRALVEPRLFALRDTCDGAGGRFDDLAAALFTGGTFVHVPRGVTLDRPVRIAHRVGGGFAASRSLVVAEAQCTATVVIDLSSAAETDAGTLHETIEIHVGRGAELRVVFVQRLGDRATHAPVVRSRVERDGVLDTVTVALGGGLVKSLQTVELAEPGARANALGIVFADGRRHLDHHTFLDHAAPSTSSDLDYRAAVAGRSRSSFTGRLRIPAAGARSSAHQSNRNLVLADTARADAIPELEILTNDVSCSHAVATSPIDEEQLHFAMTRGLSPADARKLIVLGFFEPALEKIPPGMLADGVREVLERKLGAAS
ncbi:MAG: hypothetical protein HMLKMBBP_03519 [Planctomycetes bacterium]|nr:hypothetical protein [Planctomycetota bacterium]